MKLNWEKTGDPKLISNASLFVFETEYHIEIWKNDNGTFSYSIYCYVYDQFGNCPSTDAFENSGEYKTENKAKSEGEKMLIKHLKEDYLKLKKIMEKK